MDDERDEVAMTWNRSQLLFVLSLAIAAVSGCSRLAPPCPEIAASFSSPETPGAVVLDCEYRFVEITTVKVVLRMADGIAEDIAFRPVRRGTVSVSEAFYLVHFHADPVYGAAAEY